MSRNAYPIPTFLPGRLTLSRGSARDYAALSGFHYRCNRPATWAGIWAVRYRELGACGAGRESRPSSKVVAAAVLSYPVPSCDARERHFNRLHLARDENLRFANRHIRTISRVIVHPQFRALGLSTLLVRALCMKSKTRYVEAIAAMGKIHPLFERAGMTRVESPTRDKPSYFIFDKESN